MNIAKLGGLQLSKPVFDWNSRDKLAELEQFKADCKITFNGPLCDLKERQRDGLLVNWLGREATQILASVEVEISTPDVVFQAEIKSDMQPIYVWIKTGIAWMQI